MVLITICLGLLKDILHLIPIMPPRGRMGPILAEMPENSSAVVLIFLFMHDLLLWSFNTV